MSKALENQYLVSVNIPKYTYSKLDYRFNGKELDPETGNYYYGARYYNPKISVWLSVDPKKGNDPHLSPYVFTANNPLFYIDPDGRDNVIYLVMAPGKGRNVTPKQAEQMATLANENFSNLGLNTRVHVVGPDQVSNFNACNIDATDAVAVIGSKSDVVDYIGAFNSDFAADLEKNWGADQSHPEMSENPRNEGGSWIALSSEGILDGILYMADPPSTGESGALLLQHGAGHNAKSRHTGDTYSEWSHNASSYLMFDGGGLRSLLNRVGFIGVAGSNAPNESGKPRNQDYINLMIDRFGENKANPSLLE